MRRVLVVIAALSALGVAPSSAVAESVPDVGRPFEPKRVSKPLYGIQAPTDDNGQRFFIEAADGTDLFLEVYLPKAKDGHVPPERIPTVLNMTPYCAPGCFPDWEELLHLVPRGYAMAYSHVRGTGASGGCFDHRGPTEVADGARVVEWLGEEAPWSNRRVGTLGPSYEGGTALSVAARGDPRQTRYLKAVVAENPYSSVYDYTHMDGVSFLANKEAIQTLYPTVFAERGGPEQVPDRLTCYPEHIPAAADQSGNVTAYHRARDDRVGVKQIRAATLLVHGWADANVAPNVQSGLFDRIPAGTPKAGLFGVWGHEDPATREESNLDPDWARADYLDMVTAWFDRYLKGLASGVETWPVAQVQGNDGQWRAEPEWPSTGGPVGQLALGPAGTLGTLEPSGTTTYTEAALENAVTPLAPGTFATFETPAMTDRLQISGQPVVDLWVTLDRPDAHVAVRLETFGPDGEPLGEQTKADGGQPTDTGATFGLRSARHLEPLHEGRFWQGEESVPPVGTPVRIQVRLQPTDLVIPEGGTVRVTIAGSLMVRGGLEIIAPSLTGGEVQVPSIVEGPSQPSGSATTVTILHYCDHPSALRFVMPRKHPDLLNVREVDEPTGPLPTVKGPVPVSDGGGLATAPVCGERPIRLESFGGPTH